MKRSSFHFTLILAFLAWNSNVFSQLSVSNASPYNSPAHLVQNVFMGGAITAFNFKWNGSTAATVSTNQMAYFSGGGNIFGIDSGIVLSSGNTLIANQNNFKSASYNGAGDADILQVAQSVGWGTPPSIMRDRSILEFDFIAPASDSIAFDYVFGSEEWPVYPCSQYNDAFGFLISGPGINGAYSNNAENVSIVPGTSNIPVAITSIQPGNGYNGSACQYATYAQYYNNGPTSQAFSFADLNTNNTYGAFTDVFQTAPIFVNACDTYHVKLGICDGVDWIFDSDVYIKAKSFDFLGINVSPTPSYNPWGFDTALYEGCGNLDLFFTRVDSTYAPYTLTYSIQGTATMSTSTTQYDYGFIPGCTYVSTTGAGVNTYDCTITFPQDSATTGFNVDIYFDNLAENIESFIFIVTDTNVTNCVGGDTLIMNIIDQPVLTLQPFGATTLDCNDSPPTIGVEVTNGLPPYTFTWSNGATTDSLQTVQPNVTTLYVVQVEDGCGFQTETEVITVGVFNVPWSVAKFGDNQTISCIDPPATMGVAVQFNDGIWHGDVSYLWSNGSTDSTISVFSLTNQTYTVTVTRNCTGETEVRSFRLNVYNDPIVLTTYDIDESLIECPGDAVTINVTATGGYPPYTYAWQDGSTTSWTIVAPLLTENFSVTVHDVCNLVQYTDEVKVNVPVADPLLIFGIANDTVPCPEQKVHFGEAVPSGGFGFGYRFSWDDFATETNVLQDIIYENTPYTIKLIDGCLADTAELEVWGIVAKKNDLSLNLTPDTTICFGQTLLITAEGVDGGGDYKYFWDGASENGSGYLKVAPVEPTTFMVRLQDACDSVRFGSINVGVSKIIADFEYEYMNDYDVALKNKSWSSDTITGYDWTVKEIGITSPDESPVFALPDGNPYTVELEARNEFGCLDVASMIVNPEFHVYIPTGFTPNNDGINDRWTISSLGIREMKLEVYDRWGNKLFSTTEKDFEWDGKYQGSRVPMGAYAWRLVLYTDHDEYVERNGSVILVNDLVNE